MKSLPDPIPYPCFWNTLPASRPPLELLSLAVRITQRMKSIKYRYMHWQTFYISDAIWDVYKIKHTTIDSIRFFGRKLECLGEASRLNLDYHFIFTNEQHIKTFFVIFTVTRVTHAHTHTKRPLESLCNDDVMWCKPSPLSTKSTAIDRHLVTSVFSKCRQSRRLAQCSQSKWESHPE